MDDGKTGLYESARQLCTGDACSLDGCESGTRGGYLSERFQRGWIALTNASGVLTLASGASITLFQRGVGGDASGAGYPASALFRDSETNVSDDNGLQDVSIYAAGVELGDPHYITGSGDSVIIQDPVELEGYREGLLRKLGENLSILAIKCPNETATVHSLGCPVRNPSMRGWKDQSFPNAGGMLGLPSLLSRVIDIPPAKGTKRPFSVTVTAARGMSFDARTTVTTETVYVPITVSFEVRPLA